jgi:hypothetical protein
VRDGDVIRKGKRTRLFNPRAAADHPVQGAAADITRTAGCLISEAGIDLLASVHDAVLIEADEERIDAAAETAERLMIDAGRQVLGQAFTLRVNRKSVWFPDRLLDEKDRGKWNWLMGRLRGKVGEKMVLNSNTLTDRLRGKGGERCSCSAQKM